MIGVDRENDTFMICLKYQMPRWIPIILRPNVLYLDSMDCSFIEKEAAS